MEGGPVNSGPHDNTQLLHRMNSDDAAGRELMTLVYDELRRLAASFMAQERRDHTLQPTALVNEAYMRLVGTGGGISWQNKAHFFAIAAKVMRRILVDHARGHQAIKRGGDERHVTLGSGSEIKGAVPQGLTDVELLCIHDALETLNTMHPRMAQVVELRYFGGLTIDESAEVLGVATSTIEADWSFARAWLKKAIGPLGGSQA